MYNPDIEIIVLKNVQINHFIKKLTRTKNCYISANKINTYAINFYHIVVSNYFSFSISNHLEHGINILLGKAIYNVIKVRSTGVKVIIISVEDQYNQKYVTYVNIIYEKLDIPTYLNEI